MGTRDIRQHEDDENEECEDSAQVREGRVTPAIESSEVAELLLELCSAGTRLTILMRELDYEGFQAIMGRFKMMTSIFAQLPTELPAPKRTGFMRD